MSTFTVIGYYEDTLQVYLNEERARDASEAFSITAEANKPTDAPLVLIAAFEGRYADEGITPCGDSGKLCYACDFPPAASNFASLSN